MRTRIIGVAVLASVLATCLFGGPLAVGVLKYLLRKERGHLVRVANDVAITVAADVYDGVPIGADDTTDLGEDGEHLTAAVFDDNGARLAGTAPVGDADVLAAALDGDIRTGDDSEVLVAAVPVTHGDEVIGAVVVSEPRSDVLTEVTLIWAAMAVLAAAAVTVAWLVGRRQARRLARPLEDLEESARRLGDGDFSVRTRRGGIEEIDAVGAALDATAARLDDLLAGERAFSADVSHQLRTPLAGLRLRLEAAGERTDPAPGAADAATLLDAQRLEAIIHELPALPLAGAGPPAGPEDPGAVV